MNTLKQRSKLHKIPGVTMVGEGKDGLVVGMETFEPGIAVNIFCQKNQVLWQNQVAETPLFFRFFSF